MLGRLPRWLLFLPVVVHFYTKKYFSLVQHEGIIMQENRKDVQNQSEVARIRAQMEAEYAAAQRAMYGFAEVAKHEYITARMERVGELHDQLEELVGDDAKRMLVEAMQRST